MAHIALGGNLPTDEDFLVAEIKDLCIAAHVDGKMTLAAILRALVDVIVLLPKDFPNEPKWDITTDVVDENSPK